MEAKTMEAKAHARRHLDEHAWGEVSRRFEDSGESVTGFCKREGLNKSSFHRWRQRLATTTVHASTAQAAQDPGEPKRPSAVDSFIEMGSMAAASAAAARLEVRLELGGGVVLQLVRR
jgi:hypothetical protein